MTTAPVQFGQYAPARRTLLHVSDTHLLAGNPPLGGRFDTAANLARALEVAESGRAVKVKRNPPPTRRQRAVAREDARRKASAEAAAKKAAKTAQKAKPPQPTASGSKDGGER